MARLARAADAAPTSTRLATLLLFATCMRIGELVAVRIADIDLDRDTIGIVGKGNRQRQVVISNECLKEAIRDYVRIQYGDDQAAERQLRGPAGGGLMATAVRLCLRRLAEAAGLPRAVTLHMPRHTAATELLESGVDIRFVRRLLRHRSILTTQIETHVSDPAIRTAIRGADLFGRLDRSRHRREVECRESPIILCPTRYIGSRNFGAFPTSVYM